MKYLYEYLEFDKLSPDAKVKAIENIRNDMYDYFDVSDLVDDDSLFEPSHSEMKKLFGDDYYDANDGSFMIANTRKDISFSDKSNQNYYLHCADAIEITNDNLFLRWLGINPIFHKYVVYRFFDPPGNQNTKIVFEIGDLDDLLEIRKDADTILNLQIDNAEKKFSQHIDNVLTNLSNQIDYEYSDESIINRIESNEYLFDDEGEKIN